MKLVKHGLVVSLLWCVGACGGSEPPEPQVVSTGNEGAPPTARGVDTTDYGERQRTRDRSVDEPLVGPLEADPARRTEWGAASVWDTVEIVEDGSCCQDLDGDGLNDNSMGSFLTIYGMVEDAQGDIDVAIGNGESVLLFEYEDFDGSGGPFEIHVARGAPSVGFMPAAGALPFQPDPDGGNPYVLDPRSLGEGDAIVSTLEATYQGGVITASADTLVLPFTLWNVPFDMPVRSAELTATARGLEDPDGGVALVGGTLGGVVHVVDVYDGLNDFVSTNCGCLGVEGDLFDYSGPGRYADASCVQEFSPEEAVARCVDGPDAPVGAIGTDCAIVATSFCQNIGALGFSLDQYTDDPSRFCFDLEPTDETPFCDGMSVAIGFTAAGAVIEGVADVE